VDAFIGSLVEAIKRKAAQAVSEAQAQAAAAGGQLPSDRPAPARPGSRRAAPEPARRVAEAVAAPARRMPAPAAEAARAGEAEPLLAPLRGGRGLLSAIVVAEALAPPLSLRERSPHW
jgi:hypothetical protein